jgi:hypothetical protein
MGPISSVKGTDGSVSVGVCARRLRELVVRAADPLRGSRGAVDALSILWDLEEPLVIPCDAEDPLWERCGVAGEASMFLCAADPLSTVVEDEDVGRLSVVELDVLSGASWLGKSTFVESTLFLNRYPHRGAPLPYRPISIR